MKFIIKDPLNIVKISTIHMKKFNNNFIRWISLPNLDIIVILDLCYALAYTKNCKLYLILYLYILIIINYFMYKLSVYNCVFLLNFFFFLHG